ncbi:MAG: hypothetical protein BWY95_02626 [Bacteroidetes bacterium ADurb.BinA104]|nr:MAG: hypothetical protein BWY95_02626 [Bacteroidetes bacterium ADurb.BinA104]
MAAKPASSIDPVELESKVTSGQLFIIYCSIAEVVSSVCSTRVPVCNSIEADNLLWSAEGINSVPIKRNKPKESIKITIETSSIKTLCFRALRSNLS